MRVRILRALAALGLAIGLVLLPGTRPQIAVACSCAGSEDPIGDAAADPDAAVFAGIAQLPERGGDVPIVLTRWFKGPAPTPVVALDGSWFDDPSGASCGTAAPTPGQEWIFVASASERATFAVSSCSPHGPVGQPHGRDLLDAAIGRFGPGLVGPSASEPPPGSSSGPMDAPPAGIVVAGTLAAAVLVLVGAVLVARRRSGDRERPPA